MELSVQVETWQSFSQPKDGSLGQIWGRGDDVIDLYQQISIFGLWAPRSRLDPGYESILISKPRKISV